MEQLIYVIKDNVSGQTSPLYLAPNDATSKREFNRFLAGELPAPPSEYDLYCVGSFSSNPLLVDSGSNTGSVFPYHVINGAAQNV